MQNRARLLEIIRERSFRTGEFTLASGRKSPYYVDVKQTSLSGEGSVLLGALLADLVAREYPGCRVFGGLTLGADPIAVSLANEVTRRGGSADAFVVRKESKSHGTTRQIEGLNFHSKDEGLLVIEDTVTSGGSALNAVEALRDAGFRILGIVSVVDRQEGGAQRFIDEGIESFHSLFTLNDIVQS